jgi:bifunctional DNA-binding transcriptional regulator/antitoxin component of YhaV-PrlF toxin-antitoxin module
MKTGIFIAEIGDDGKFAIPQEIKERLQITEGDKVEVLLKKIRSKRFSVIIQKNPLFKLLELSDLKD